VAASTELRKRDALKSVDLATAMTAALIARGVPDPIAHLAGELGVLAFKQGYAQWSESDRDDAEGLAPHALAALEDLRAATASLAGLLDCGQEAVARVVDDGVQVPEALGGLVHRLPHSGFVSARFAGRTRK
jgi:GAF domain-containing protein